MSIKFWSAMTICSQSFYSLGTKPIIHKANLPSHGITAHATMPGDMLSFKSLFTIETIQSKSYKVLKSLKIPNEKFCPYQGLNPGLLPIMTLMHILLNSIDSDMISEIGSSRVGLLSLEVPCKGSWCRSQTYPTWAPKGGLPL